MTVLNFKVQNMEPKMSAVIAFTMLHSNAGELHQLFSTFNRVWGNANLSLKTVDGA